MENAGRKRKQTASDANNLKPDSEKNNLEKLNLIRKCYC